MTRIRAGVVGVGKLGREHARLLRESDDFELVGLRDTDADRARAVARETGVPVFDDLRSLTDAADALVVAVPTVDHVEVATRCLDEACHVLVEKPLARTPREADAIIEAAARRDRVLGVGHVERFNGILAAAEPYMDGVRFIESQRLARFQPRGTDVTVILDLMIHDIDLVLALVDAPIAEIRAIGAPVITGSIDMANARLAFANGAVANISASRAASAPVRGLRLFQHSGYFSLDLARGTGEHLRRVASPPAKVRGIEDLVERIPLTAEGGEPLARELAAFAAAIRGAPSRLVRGAQGREALAVAERITREIEESVDVAAQDS